LAKSCRQHGLEVARARQIVDDTMLLPGEDLLTATYWMNIRQARAPDPQLRARAHGRWSAFRQTVPWQQKPSARPAQPVGDIVYASMTHPAAEFYPPSVKDIDAEN
jgi:histidine ammonia-lyase